MGDKQKVKIETTLGRIEERLADLPQMTESDRRAELRKLSGQLDDLESDIQRFQMTEYNKFPEACDEFEQRFGELTEKFKNLGQAGAPGEAAEDEAGQSEDQDATQRQIAETSAKLKEGKNRALAILHTINNMKEEINLIDDEVMLQREKLLSVNQKLKETQSVLSQTKKLVAFFSKAVYDDVIIKVLIGLILVAIIVVLVFGFTIKSKREKLLKEKEEQTVLEKENQHYEELDEMMFMNYAYSKEVALLLQSQGPQLPAAGGAEDAAGKADQNPATKRPSGSAVKEPAGKARARTLRETRSKPSALLGNEIRVV